jgi:hypothetical protein
LGGAGVDWKIHADIIILKKKNNIGAWMIRDSVVSVVTRLRPGPPSYSVGYPASFQGVKAAQGVKLTTHLSAVQRRCWRNECSYTSTPPLWHRRTKLYPLDWVVGRAYLLRIGSIDGL